MMELSEIERNDVLQINGTRYEVLSRNGGIFTEFGGSEVVIELNRIGEPPQDPRFTLIYSQDETEEPVRFWERDPQTQELIDTPIESMHQLSV